RERVVLRQRPHGRARGKAVIELEGPDVGGEAPRRKVDVVAAEVGGGGEPVGHTYADATTEIDTVSVPEGLGRVVDVEGDAPGRVAPEGEVQVPEVVVTLRNADAARHVERFVEPLEVAVVDHIEIGPIVERGAHH